MALNTNPIETHRQTEPIQTPDWCSHDDRRVPLKLLQAAGNNTATGTENSAYLGPWSGQRVPIEKGYSHPFHNRAAQSGFADANWAVEEKNMPGHCGFF